MEGKLASSRKRKDKLATAAEALNKLAVPAEIPKKKRKNAKDAEETIMLPAECDHINMEGKELASSRKRKDKLAAEQATAAEQGLNKLAVPAEISKKKRKKSKDADEEHAVMLPAESLFLTLLDALSTYVDQKAYKSGGNKERGKQGKQLRWRDIFAMEKCNNRIAKVTEQLLKFDKYYAASGRHVILIGRFLNKPLFTIASGVMDDSMKVKKIRDVAIEQGVKVQE